MHVSIVYIFLCVYTCTCIYVCIYRYMCTKRSSNSACVFMSINRCTLLGESVLQVCKGLKLVDSDTLRTQADRLVCGNAFEILPLSEMNTEAEKT